MLRVVLDTNLLISALALKSPAMVWLRIAWQAEKFIPVASDETIRELIRVIAYPKFRLSPEDQESLLEDYLPFAETLKSPRSRARLPMCRDPADEMFLRIAYAAKVDALVTGDSDLLALAGLSKVAIIEPAELKRLYTAT